MKTDFGLPSDIATPRVHSEATMFHIIKVCKLLHPPKHPQIIGKVLTEKLGQVVAWISWGVQVVRSEMQHVSAF